MLRLAKAHDLIAAQHVAELLLPDGDDVLVVLGWYTQQRRASVDNCTSNILGALKLGHIIVIKEMLHINGPVIITNELKRH